VNDPEREVVKEFKYHEYSAEYFEDGTVNHKEINRIMNRLNATFRNKFEHIDFPDLSNEEKIETLAEMHIFYHKMLPRVTNESNSKQIVIHNLIIKMAMFAREAAKIYGLEDEVSRRITEETDDPFNKVLRDNGKHRFQYENELSKAYKLHRKIVHEDSEFLNLISPRILIDNYQHRKLLKLSVGVFKNNQNKFGNGMANARSIIEYSIYMDRTFPEKFCNDYARLQELLSNGTVEYTKHAPY
jgi:hypothetical protein